jgi:hypothetical protein
VTITPLSGAQPLTRFIDATPGSVVEATGQSFPYGPVEAVVIDLIQEFGAQHIPALVLKIEGEPEPKLITSSGRDQIRIIRGTKNMTGKFQPQTAVTANLIPEKVQAVQFVGGATVATEIIQWTAGKLNISYHPGAGVEPEVLIAHRLNEDTTIAQGDWVVEHADGRIEVFTGDRFAASYDVDPTLRGLGSTVS